MDWDCWASVGEHQANANTDVEADNAKKRKWLRIYLSLTNVCFDKV